MDVPTISAILKYITFRCLALGHYRRLAPGHPSGTYCRLALGHPSETYRSLAPGHPSGTFRPSCTWTAFSFLDIMNTIYAAICLIIKYFIYIVLLALIVLKKWMNNTLVCTGFMSEETYSGLFVIHQYIWHTKSPSQGWHPCDDACHRSIVYMNIIRNKVSTHFSFRLARPITHQNCPNLFKVIYDVSLATLTCQYSPRN